MAKLQFALYHHVGSGNRGCEALVDATGALLRSAFDAPVYLYSQRMQEDVESAYAQIDSIRKVNPAAPVSLRTGDKICLKATRTCSLHAADMMYFKKYFRSFPFEEDVFLSIGGDNYCYGEINFMHAFDAELKRRKKTTVLWGCSLDETSFSKYNAQDLRTYDAIFARETGTYTLLHEKGFSENVFLHPDPAFTLPATFLPLPQGLQEGKFIGINASPLVFSYEKNKQRGVGMQAYERLISWILSETDNAVLLIPHVFWDFSDDREVLREIYAKFAETGRVVMLGQTYSARELKGFIARCRAFVGARTHSTIAAYSSCVPTLVLGYSVKSVNIALDLFGKTDGFVVPVDQLDDPDGLRKAFEALLQNELLHRETLSACVPDYVHRASQAALTLRDFLQRR